MDSLGFVAFVLIAVFIQLRKLVKKFGNGNFKDIAGDFFGTLRQINQSKRNGGGSEQTEILFSDFVKRRFPKAALRYNDVKKKDDFKEVLSKNWQAEKGQSNTSVDHRQVFGQEGTQPNSEMVRYILIGVFMVAFLGIGLYLLQYFGFFQF